MRDIYIAGYPRSGTVFLTRLLGDALDCTTSAYWDSKNNEEIAAAKRPGPVTFRRGHYRLISDDHPDGVVPSPHVLAYNHIQQDQGIVLIIRDPRDIAVSASKYFHGGNQSIINAIHWIGSGQDSMRAHGSWQNHMFEWDSLLREPRPYPVIAIRFRTLVKHRMESVRRIADALDIPTPNRVEFALACDRHSVAATKKRIQNDDGLVPLGKRLQLHHIRKGVPGDWVNHFGAEEAYWSEKYFGPTMRSHGFGAPIGWIREFGAEKINA